MIAVLKGDIIASRKLVNQEIWLHPLTTLFNQWGNTPQQWELVWGDFFQLEVVPIEDALKKALLIKALIKKLEPSQNNKNISAIDVRMSIGLGDKTYIGQSISQSNGPAFINAGEKFSLLKKEKINLAIQSPWKSFDEEMNLYIRLASTFMDNWSISSAELIEIVLNEPNITQKEIGVRLGIKQNSVSGRWARAHVDEILAIERTYRTKIKQAI